MKYKCNECEHEFEVMITEHPHSMYTSSRFDFFGCPVCKKALASPKKCPHCSSSNVNMML